MNGNAEEWLFFARQDIRVAELALGDEIYHQVCFHGQQCVEKALKATLVHLGQNPPRVHSIADLLDLLPTDFVESLPEQLVRFDLFYIPTRYPDAFPGSLPDGLPSKKQAVDALDWAKQTLSTVEKFTAKDVKGEDEDDSTG